MAWLRCLMASFMEKEFTPGSATQAVLQEIRKSVPAMENDMYLYPHILTLKDMIHQGSLIKVVEEKIGLLI